MTLPFGDDPIATPVEDLLGRERLADVLAAEIGALDAGHGAVVAITGPWGSGKTSLMNLAAARLRQNPQVLGVVEFNPWLFSGAEQLAENLLSELATQLREQESRKAKSRRVATKATSTLLRYSRGLSVLRAVPVVGPVADAVDKGLEGADTLLRGDQSLQRRRQDAVTALAGLTRRVVVLVDDIDRLTRTETRDLFRTVRLSASFPNVVYVLCLDDRVVAGALNEEGFSGKAYLEKILTVTCRVPELADHQIGQLFVDGLNTLLARHTTGPDDDDLWAAAYPEIIRPLFTTVRDAKRVLASLPITLRLIGDELPVVDVVVLECLRTLYPDLHAAVTAYAYALTESPPTGLNGGDKQELTTQTADFVAVDQRFDGRLATALVRTLFPHAAGRLPSKDGWPSAGTPAAGGVGWRTGLIYYLTHELPPGIAPAGPVRAIVTAFGDEEALRTAFATLPDDRLEDALGQIARAAEIASPDAAAATVRVLLELFPRLRTGRSGMFDFGAQFAIRRPVLSLLQRLPCEEVEELATQLVTSTPTIYAAYELVGLVGHQEHVGHRLVGDEHAAKLENRLRERLAAAEDELAGERDLATVLFHSCHLREGQPVFPAVSSLPVAATILKTSVAVTQSTSLGAGPSLVKQARRLRWETLTALYGGEDRLTAVATDLIASRLWDTDADLHQALDLVLRYLDGWRPPDYFRDSFDNQA